MEHYICSEINESNFDPDNHDYWLAKAAQMIPEKKDYITCNTIKEVRALTKAINEIGFKSKIRSVFVDGLNRHGESIMVQKFKVFKI